MCCPRGCRIVLPMTSQVRMIVRRVFLFAFLSAVLAGLPHYDAGHAVNLHVTHKHGGVK